MADSVDVVESNRNRDAVETALENWLTNNSPTSIDYIKPVYEMNDRVGIAVIYTA